jgi:ribosomal-protein-alanine N-acetyltransferase
VIGFLSSLLGRVEPSITEASARDASAIAILHGKSFRRGWSEQEVEGLLLDRHVIVHRAATGKRLAGFIMSKIVEDEAEILSVAVAGRQRGRGLARRLLDLHLRRLAGLGARTIFLEVDEHNGPALRLYHGAGFHEVSRRRGYYPGPGAMAATALILRRDLV